METSTRSLGRSAALDGLRGVSIALVFAYHLGPTVASAGFLGVDVFFVLSGFLITTLLLEEHQRKGTLSLRGFYLRRAARLMPALATLLIAVGAWEHCGLPGSGAQPTRDLVATALYVANFAAARSHLGLFQHCWSLAQEEQFYFLWPAALLVLLARGGRRAALAFCVVSTLAVVVARFVAWRPGELIDGLYHLPQYRLDGMMIGCALAIARAEGLLRRVGLALRLTAALAPFGLAWAVFSARMGEAWLYQGGFTAVSLLAGALIVDVTDRPEGLLARSLSRPALVRAGELSYALYLWHFPIGYVLHAFGRAWLAPFAAVFPSPAASLAPRLVTPAVTLALSWCIAELSMRWIESPIRRAAGRLSLAR